MPASETVGPYERLVMLRATSIGVHPPLEALVALALQSYERRFPAGARLEAPDRQWDNAYVVVEGGLGIYDGADRVYSVQPREPFGLLEVLARSSGGLEARADTSTLVLVMPATTLFSILEGHFVLTLDLIRALGRLLLKTPEWLADSICRREIAVPRLASTGKLDLADRIRLLRANNVFQHTRIDSLAEIADHYQEFRAEPGTVLWEKGDNADWIMTLLDGTIEATADGLSFKWPPGTVPGMVDAMAGAPRWHRAVASTPVIGLRLGAERFVDALEDDFGMASDIMAALARLVRLQRRALHASPLTSESIGDPIPSRWGRRSTRADPPSPDLAL